MKRKVIAIALSLALLVTLFAFAGTAIAKPDKSFEVTFTMERTGYPSGQSGNRHWLGGPATITLPFGSLEGADETRTIDPGIMEWWPWTAYGEIIGDFGQLGELSGRYDYQTWSTYNYFTGTMHGIQIVEAKFFEDYDPALEPEEWGDLLGTANLYIVHENTMLYWRDPASSPHQTRYDDNATFTLIGGTGIFKHISMSGTGIKTSDEIQYFNYEGTAEKTHPDWFWWW